MITKRFKRRKRFQGIIFPIICSLFILLIVSFLIISNLKINRRRRELLSQISYLEEAIETLKKENVELSDEIFQTGTEEYLEKKLREELLLKKPGEEVVGIIEGEETVIEIEEEKSLLEKILEFLRIK